MGHGIVVDRDGMRVTVDGRDVGRAMGVPGPPDPDDPAWRSAAEAYVDAHPRPGGNAAAQRLQVLRTLAAGPATTAMLLEAMREAGYVGATDLENRLRDLRAGDRRGGGRQIGLDVATDGDVHVLQSPFPALSPSQLRALGFVKSVVASQHVPLAAQGQQALDGMLPGVGIHTGEPVPAVMTLTAAAMHRFEAARISRTPVEVAYYSMNSAQQKTYLLVPVEYVPVGPALKAVCIEVGPDGDPTAERQFALDRIRSVTPTSMRPLDEDDIALERQTLDIEVTGALYRIMRDRNQFGVATADAAQVDLDRWRVRGEFPVALGWDVMEQMCAWAGSVIVHGPLWLVNAVMRRMRAGMRAMEDAEMELVKPDPTRQFPDLQAAITDTGPDVTPPPTGPRKLPPPAPA